MRTTTLAILTLFAFACTKTETASPAPAPEAVTAPAAPAKLAPAKAAPVSTSKSAPTVKPLDGVELPLGEPGAQPALPFQIVKVYEKQQPAEAAPWHRPGGDWTFFDARLEGQGPVDFTFGLRLVAPKGPFPMAFSDAILATPDRASAARLLAGLSFALRVQEPKAGPERPVAPLKMRVVILGQHQARDPRGGFSSGGTWVATKLFLEQGKRSGEVFFNFDPVGRRGEFSEKDRDYDADVVAVVASLRDGAADKHSR